MVDENTDSLRVRFLDGLADMLETAMKFNVADIENFNHEKCPSCGSSWQLYTGQRDLITKCLTLKEPQFSLIEPNISKTVAGELRAFANIERVANGEDPIEWVTEDDRTG